MYNRIILVVFAILLAGCTSVSVSPSASTLDTRYPAEPGTSRTLLFVEGAGDGVSDKGMILALKVTSNGSSDKLARLLRTSDVTPVAVAGSSVDILTATVRRAIKDAGGDIPRNGTLLIYGDAGDFAEVIRDAAGKGLTMRFLKPAY